MTHEERWLNAKEQVRQGPRFGTLVYVLMAFLVFASQVVLSAMPQHNKPEAERQVALSRELATVLSRTWARIQN